MEIPHLAFACGNELKVSLPIEAAQSVKMLVEKAFIRKVSNMPACCACYESGQSCGFEVLV